MGNCLKQPEAGTAYCTSFTTCGYRVEAAFQKSIGRRQEMEDYTSMLLFDLQNKKEQRLDLYPELVTPETSLGSEKKATAPSEPAKTGDPNLADQYKVAVDLPAETIDLSWFSIFDGHGGKRVASLCTDKMHKIFLRKLNKEPEKPPPEEAPKKLEAQGSSDDSSDGSSDSESNTGAAEQAQSKVDQQEVDDSVEGVLIDTYFGMDTLTNRLKTIPKVIDVGPFCCPTKYTHLESPSNMGTTATTLLMYKKEKEVVDGTVEDLEVVIGHCGDSRLLMFTLEGDYRSKLKNSQKQMFSAVTKLNVGWSKSSLNVADKRVKGSSQAVEKTALKKKGEVVLDRIYETADHQPSLESERNRIIQSGNQVINSRVNGVLAVSRALGDRDLKMTQAVIATPDIFSLSMSSLFEPNVERASGAGEEAEPNEDEKEVFIVLASDGLWAATTSHSVEVFIKRYLQTLPTTNKEHSNEGSREEELKGLCEEIMEDLLFERFSADNVAIIILRITKLKQGEQRAGAAVRKEQDKEQNENVLEQTGQQETTVGNVSSLEVFHNDDPGNAAQRTPKPTENKAPEKLGAVRHHLNHELETEIEVDVEMDV